MLRTVPEFAVLIGFAPAALVGYLLLLLSNSAVSIVPGLVVAIIGCEMWVRHRGNDTAALPELVERYRQFRFTMPGLLCWLVFGVGIAAVVMSRLGWVLERSSGGTIEMGTLVYDDMRTVGFPMSLAAFGVPLRNPLAVETFLMYPLGAFVLPAGIIALFPHAALAAIVADTVVITLLFVIVLMVFAARFDRPWVTVLFAVSCIFSVPLHWGFASKTSWYPALFGYAKDIFTVGNTTLVGLVMLGNHAVGLTMFITAGLLYSVLPLWIVTMLAATGAITSMDMTVFALVAAGLWLLYRRRLEWRFISVCAVALVITLLIMLPGLTGKMDGLQPRGPSFLRQNLFPLGAVISTEGSYFVIIAVGLIFATARQRLTPLISAGIAPLLFLLAFHWGSFWFWRGHFAIHPLFSMLCLAVVASIPSGAARTAVVGLWSLAVIPGILHSANDFKWFRTASPPVSVAKAEALHWIYNRTKLEDRVVSWKPAEATLAPSVDYLRAGSRAGKTVYDRYHVVIGYQRNLEMMSDLRRGIAANDYVIYERNDADFEDVLVGCKAPVAFQNQAVVIYKIDAKCRASLPGQPGIQHIDPMTAAPAGFAIYLSRHTAEAGSLARKRAEKLWEQKKYADAVALLTAAAERVPNIAEVHYSLGFSLQQLGRHKEAVAAFTRALDAGYLEFWARYARGTSYLDLHEKSKAREDLARATKLDPTHTGAKTLLEAASK